jgi:hypothetical protein
MLTVSLKLHYHKTQVHQNTAGIKLRYSTRATDVAERYMELQCYKWCPVVEREK